MTWLVVTGSLALVAFAAGLAWGMFKWPRRVGLLAVGGIAALVVLTGHEYKHFPSWGWWVLTGIFGLAAAVLAWVVARNGIDWTGVAVGAIVIACAGGVAAGAFRAGEFVQRADIKTRSPSDPGGVGNWIEPDPADCSHASVSATRLDKPATWAALGDSYSAGVGGRLNGTPYGQDITNAFAWAGAQQLYNPVDGTYVGLRLSACLGAVTRDIFHTIDEPKEQLQLSDLPDEITDQYWWQLPDALQSLKDAAVVTLTVGGNDAGFGNIAGRLFNDDGCARVNSCRLLRDGGLGNINGEGRWPIPEGKPADEWADLRGRLVNAYAVTRSLMLPEADLYVVKYPLAFANPTGRCDAARLIGRDHIRLLNQFAATLDETIDEAVKQAEQDTHRPIHVLAWGDDHPTNVDGVPYSNHGLCGHDPWLNDFGPRREGRSIEDSFHPSPLGAVAAGCATAKTIAETSTLVRGNGFKFTPSGHCPAN